jgi:hypothetical protein
MRPDWTDHKYLLRQCCLSSCCVTTLYVSLICEIGRLGNMKQEFSRYTTTTTTTTTTIKYPSKVVSFVVSAQQLGITWGFHLREKVNTSSPASASTHRSANFDRLLRCTDSGLRSHAAERILSSTNRNKWNYTLVVYLSFGTRDLATSVFSLTRTQIWWKTRTYD